MEHSERKLKPTHRKGARRNPSGNPQQIPAEKSPAQTIISLAKIRPQNNAFYGILTGPDKDTLKPIEKTIKDTTGKLPTQTIIYPSQHFN